MTERHGDVCCAIVGAAAATPLYDWVRQACAVNGYSLLSGQLQVV